MMGLRVGIWSLLAAILISAELIVLAVLAMGALFPRRDAADRSPKTPGAREILDRRYAQGELSREQYELMKRDIADD